ncbi:hypothetical protein Tco_1476417 [Tanacetum coccineum]
MTGDRSRLRNFVKKFIGTVRFGNDHFGAIMGYGDYVIGDSVISRVYYVEGLGHNLFLVGQFCDSDLEVAFRKHTCYVRDTDGVELIKGSRGSNLYTISVEDMMKSSPICLLSKASKNKSCEDLGKLQPMADIGIFVGYAPSRKGYRIYNKRTRRIMETIHVQFDELTEHLAPVQLSTGPAPTFLMPGQISSGLVPNPVPAAPYVPPCITLWFVGKDGREVFGMPIPDALLTDEITKNTRLLKRISRTYKRMLSTAVKLWTCNLVTRQRVEDFQIGIKSYQTQLNLTKPGWDTTGYEFKHEYTIIESPRAVIFPVNNNERKIMRFNEIYKFSDGMLTRILETLDYRVKEFKIKRLNSSMNTRFWIKKDVTRSKEFITTIERRLKTRRIYRNLECFVSGRVCDIDYRLLQRTE